MTAITGLTGQRADLALSNLLVKDTFACPGTARIAELTAMDAKFNTVQVDFVHVAKQATFPPGTIPTPTPVPPPPPPIPGSLMLDGDLSVAGNTTLNTLTVTGATALEGPTTTSGALTANGTNTLADLTVTGASVLEGPVTLALPPTFTNITVTGLASLNNMVVTGTADIGPPGSSSTMIYVNKTGNDVTGDGKLFTPFLTIQRAMTAITDSSQTKQYSVVCGPGTYNDNFALKPWVSLA